MRPTIETQHVDWIADCVQYLRDHGFSRIDAEEDAEDAWVQHNNEGRGSARDLDAHGVSVYLSKENTGPRREMKARGRSDLEEGRRTACH